MRKMGVCAPGIAHADQIPKLSVKHVRNKTIRGIIYAEGKTQNRPARLP